MPRNEPLSDEDLSFSDTDKSPVSKKKKKPAPAPRKPSPKKVKKSIEKPQASEQDVAASSSDEGENLDIELDEEDLLNLVVPPGPAQMEDNTTGERLTIKQIVVTNFKSYYGTQTIGPFHKNFTAIVGPNGSGKSNVIDSLLFIFGYKSSKIRSKKIATLIHSSAGRDNINSCTVEVHFQRIIDKGEKSYDVVPNSQFRVSRTAFRDNTSRYQLNGKTINYKELALHLRAVGIDLIHNRFLILQGEVEQIAMMKPKAQTPNDEGMLEYLEDIIGSARFKAPIDKLGEKIDKLAAERSAQNTRVTNAEKDRKQLEGPVHEMITFLRMENTLTIARNKLMQIKKHSYQKQFDERIPTRDEVAETLEKTDAELKTLLAERKEREKDAQNIEKEKESCVFELEAVKREIGEIEAAETKRASDLKRCNADIDKFTKDLKKTQDKIEELQNAPTRIEQKLRALRSTVQALQEEEDEAVKKLESNRREFETRTEDDREELNDLETELTKFKDTENELRGKLTLAKEQLNLMTDEERKAKKRLDDLTTNINNLKTSQAAKTAELDDINETLPKNEVELTDTRTQQTKLKRELDKVTEERNLIRGRLDAERSQVQSNQQGTQLSRVLMAAKADGTLPGLIGRLGDLAAIDDKYDVAISTTVPGLNHYVVEDVATGKKCLNLVNERGLPRTTFLVLEQTEERQSMNKKTNYGAPRIFDLLTIPDQRLRKVFYSQCYDMVVVDDLLKAQEINKQHHIRVCTLNGATIENSGALTGGGRPNKGLIGNKVRVDSSKDSEKLIAQYEKQEAEKLEVMRDLNAKSQQNDQRIFQLTSAISKQSARRRQLSAELEGMVVSVRTTQEQLRLQVEQVANTVTDEASVQKQRDEIDDLKKELEAATGKSKPYEDKIVEVKARIQSIEENLITCYQKQAETARKTRESTTADINKETGALSNVDRNKKKAETSLKEIEENLKTKLARQKTLESQEEKNTEDLEKLKEKRIECDGQLKEIEAKLKEARKSGTDDDKKEVELNKLITEKKEDLKQIELEMAELQRQMKKLKTEIEGLKLTNIHELGVSTDKNRNAKADDFFGEDLDDEDMRRKKKNNKNKEVSSDEDAETEDTESEGGNRKEKEDVDSGRLAVYSSDELESMNREELLFKEKTYQAKIEGHKKGGGVNLNIIPEYQVKVKRYEAEKATLDSIKKRYADHLNKQEQLKKDRMDEFMMGFSKIGVQLKEMYQMITLGGDASLDVKDALDPFSEGITFMVRPPKKSWKIIENLSGGEKTLASLSLVFALHHYRPTPLYVMDEIDAALDFRNVSIIGHYIKERTRDAQFIVISLRNNMFELGDRLVGIYKTFDATKNVVLDPDLAVEEIQVLRQGIIQAAKENRDLPPPQQPNREILTEKNDGLAAESAPPRKRMSVSPSKADSKRIDRRATPPLVAGAAVAFGGATEDSFEHYEDASQ